MTTIARTINPIHTPGDGDTIFALSTGQLALDGPDLPVGVLAAEAVARAVIRGVKLARGVPGVPSAAELGSLSAER